MQIGIALNGAGIASEPPVTNRVHLYGAESGRDRPTSNEPQLTGQRRRMQGFIFPKPILWA
jgi:hypothetical protein